MPDWRKHLDAALSAEQMDPARLIEIREEITEHLDDRYHALLAEGVGPADAEKQIAAELEQTPLGPELCGIAKRLWLEPEGKGGNLFSSAMRDFRYGWRQLRLSPG